MAELRVDPWQIPLRDRVLSLRDRVMVMGVLNVTPDSFSDGGLYMDPEAALRRAEEMLAEGAEILDIGGESTRPKGRFYGEGAQPVSAEEELRRILPVIEAIRSRFPEAILSVDTYKASVARAALEAGAHMINDISGGTFDPDMLPTVAAFGAPIVLMHLVGSPRHIVHEAPFVDVVAEVKAALARAVRRAEEAGIQYCLIDPGFGFGKRPSDNLRLVRDLDRLQSLGRPIVIGVSRKSTLGVVLGGAPPSARLYAGLAATAVAVLRGARVIRTHDVRPTVELVRTLEAIQHPERLERDVHP
ncbi:MAG: dihydropteroate synthase [Bacteroidetes bacterium]|nr:dihydropteroate synthase [Rhodothermia bacterium]MCS7154934.1 dihydropteroate synthase [Bacteroidota bacterium]MCX7906907.1 dihydropteroate synthase [Bacteroidota bacterium]MDW8137729.1 dihydropteroate synthase [Bacteroidota bacterium]MDW8285317.1 dihydropteroate synthase [Bacteroidota bacterium]